VKVLLMPANVDGNGYYRCLYPGKQLARIGHQVSWVPHQVVSQGRTIALRYEHVQQGQVLAIDQVLYQMDFDALLMGYRNDPGIAQMVANLRAQGKRVVVDCDDDWLNVPSYNPGSRLPKEQVDEQCRLLEQASAVTVATPALEKTFKHLNDDITVIRNALDWICGPTWKGFLRRRFVSAISENFIGAVATSMFFAGSWVPGSP